jgi:hypothetical protein
MAAEGGRRGVSIAILRLSTSLAFISLTFCHFLQEERTKGTIEKLSLKCAWCRCKAELWWLCPQRPLNTMGLTGQWSVTNGLRHLWLRWGHSADMGFCWWSTLAWETPKMPRHIFLRLQGHGGCLQYLPLPNCPFHIVSDLHFYLMGF